MTYKIWFQGATDRVHMAPYISKVEAHLKNILDPEFSATFHTTTPPATTTHAITEFRIARNLIRNAVEAERQGYAAMAITHFQDAGLMEVKSVVDIPVLGLGETTLFHAVTLGRKLGRHALDIERTSVRIDDVNGPRGGVDKSCRIKVVLSGLPSVVVEEQDASLHAAFDRALARVHRTVREALKRRRVEPRRSKAKI